MWKKINLIWIISIFLLALPLANAAFTPEMLYQKYFTDGNNLTINGVDYVDDGFFHKGGGDTTANPSRININFTQNIGLNGNRTNFTVNWISNYTGAQNLAGPMFIVSNVTAPTAYTDYPIRIDGGSPSLNTIANTGNGAGGTVSLGGGGKHLNNYSIYVNWSATGKPVYNFYVNSTFKGNLSDQNNNPLWGFVMFSHSASEYSSTANFTVCTSNVTDFGCKIAKNPASSPADTTPPIINASLNISIIRINNVINISANATDETGLSACQFVSNITGIKIYTNISISGTADTCSNKYTISLASGNVINITVIANDTSNNKKQNETIFTVAGNVSPTLSLNTNNFFNSQNTSIISLNRSSRVLLNLTLTDDIDLFAIEVNITNQLGTLITNFSNESLSGSSFTFAKLMNVSAPEGYYNISIEVTDSHTAKEISDYEVDKFIDTLVFDKNIRIQADGAIWADTEKENDRYSFKFSYIPFIAPKVKTYYIKSENKLTLIRDSKYKAHFVDYKSGKWIDFEGIEGKPTITKISDKEYKIEFNHEGSYVEFKSIGGLNRNVQYYQYYLSNASIDFYRPEPNVTIFGQDSIFVSFNVTGNGRNTTTIYLSNSTREIINNITISNTGNGTYFYNTTFTFPFKDNTFYINATHTDINRENVTSMTKTFYNLLLTNGTVGYPAINFTILDEVNGSRIKGTATGTFTYNGTNPIKTYNSSSIGNDNFTVFVFPSSESILTDYEIIYSATGYVQRTFNDEDAVLTNSTARQNLYLLSTADGIYGTFRVIDAFNNGLADVLIEMKDSSGNVLETQMTDDSGVASFWVNPDSTYTFTFTKTGFAIKTSSLRITTSDLITVILEQQEQDEQVSFYSGISYEFNPHNVVLQNLTVYTFNFSLDSSYWNLTDCSFYIRNASTIFNQTSCFYNGTRLNATLRFNTQNYTQLIAEAIYQINNTNNFTVNEDYKVQYQFQGRGSLKNFLDDITSFTDSDFDAFGRFIIGIILTVLILGAMVKEGNIKEEEILITSVIILTWFFSYLGWYNIPIDMPQIRFLAEDWLNQWIVSILVTITGVTYLVRDGF